MGGYLPQVFERFGSDYPAVMEAFRGLAERNVHQGPGCAPFDPLEAIAAAHGRSGARACTARPV